MALGFGDVSLFAVNAKPVASLDSVRRVESGAEEAMHCVHTLARAALFVDVIREEALVECLRIGIGLRDDVREKQMGIVSQKESQTWWSGVLGPGIK